MMLVTLADACLRLPELIGLAASGESVVIVQNGVTLAALTPPPFTIPTPEEEVARRAKAEELERLIARWHAEDGVPYPPAGESPLFPRPESPAA